MALPFQWNCCKIYAKQITDIQPITVRKIITFITESCFPEAYCHHNMIMFYAQDEVLYPFKLLFNLRHLSDSLLHCLLKLTQRWYITCRANDLLFKSLCDLAAIMKFKEMCNITFFSQCLWGNNDYTCTGVGINLQLSQKNDFAKGILRKCRIWTPL